MSGAFIYNYEITRNGITTARHDDPANPALVNTATGVRSLSSLVYVPYNAAKQGTGPYRDRSLELPRTDGRKGTVQTITYPAANGTNRGMSVYLPYGYSQNTTKPYNVLYINMGNSGDQFGDELRWMNEGALPKIVDNLVAQGHEPFVAVSMNTRTGATTSRASSRRPQQRPALRRVPIQRVDGPFGSRVCGTERRRRHHRPLLPEPPGCVLPVRDLEQRREPHAGAADKGRGVRGLHHRPHRHGQVGLRDRGPADGRRPDRQRHRSHLPGDPGGHDWELWQLMFSDFAKNHLWHDTGQVYPTSTTLPGQVLSNSAGTTANNKPVDVTTAQANAAVDAGVAAAQAADCRRRRRS